MVVSMGLLTDGQCSGGHEDTGDEA
jgi:hypothetical protein